MTFIKSFPKLNLTASLAPNPRQIPLAIKLAFTAFMAVLVPVYWKQYGPTNFLYFCDLALFITLAAMWLENRLLASMAAVGIILPQMLLWCGDFAAHLVGLKFIGMTDYMFDTHRSLFLRGLSLDQKNEAGQSWLPIQAAVFSVFDALCACNETCTRILFVNANNLKSDSYS
jgi:hypothetical protein